MNASDFERTTSDIRLLEVAMDAGDPWEFVLSHKVMRASDGAQQIYGFATSKVPLAVVQNCALPEYRPFRDDKGYWEQVDS